MQLTPMIELPPFIPAPAPRPVPTGVSSQAGLATARVRLGGPA